MLKPIPQLSETETEVLASVVKALEKESKLLEVICFGIRQRYRTQWTVFKSADIPENDTTLDLLIVTESLSQSEKDRILNRVQSCNGALQLIPFIHSSQAIKEELKKNNFFFQSALVKGHVFYKRKDDPLDELEMGHQATTREVEKALTKWDHKIELAKEFLHSGVDSLTAGGIKVPLFLFHQAIEHSCSGLIHLATGYRPTTHNLTSLFNTTENFTQIARYIFPRNTKEEYELFNLLERGYTDSRYKKDFSVSPNALFTLSERVSEFLEKASAFAERAIQASQRTGHEISLQESFNTITLEVIARVTLVKSDKEMINVVGKDGNGSLISARVENKKLYLTSIPSDSLKDCDVEVFIYYRELTGLSVYHVTSLNCSEPIEASKLGIHQGSRADIHLEVDVGQLDVALTKGGSIIIRGSASELKLLSTGSGSFLGASNFSTDIANVFLKGSGDSSLQIDEELSAEIIGAGNLYITGQPRLKRLNITGTGRLNHQYDEAQNVRN